MRDTTRGEQQCPPLDKYGVYKACKTCLQLEVIAKAYLEANLREVLEVVQAHVAIN